jgi:hypothetical protein
MRKEAVVVLIKALSHNLPRGIEENHKPADDIADSYSAL